MNTICSAGVKRVTLLDLRDGDLPAHQTEQLQAHVQSCTACSAYLREIAHYQWLLRSTSSSAPSIQDHLWRDLQQQIVQHPERNLTMSLARNPIIRSLGTIAAVVLMIVVVVQGTHFLQARRGDFAKVSVTSQGTINTANAMRFTLPEPMAAIYIAPDGGTVIGLSAVTSGNQSTDTIARYSVASGTLQTLYTNPPYTAVQGLPVTDGHYLAWLLGPNDVPASEGYITTLMVMDLQTMQTQPVAQKLESNSALSSVDFQLQLVKGHLFWSNFAPPLPDTPNFAQGTLWMRDLAAATNTELTTSLATSLNSGSTPPFQVSWPEALFSAGDANHNIQEHLLDVVSGNERALPQPQLPPTVPLQNAVAYQIFGPSVIVGWLSSNGAIGFSAFDVGAQNSPNATWHPVLTIAGPYTFRSVAYTFNDRLILFRGQLPSTASDKQVEILGWDRQLLQLITIASFVDTGVSSTVSAALLGNWLIVTTFPADGQTTQYTLLDTTSLSIQTRG